LYFNFITNYVFVLLKSINREIGVLKLMAHPSISRLISSFRFQDGAYLVPEYCSGGDLHSLIKRNGSLEEESTRFVSGEVVAALNYIHDLGFVFGDLKPENILISETEHIKLVDFGGARPVTDQAKNMIKEGSTNALKTLRDGDWRPTLNHNDSSTAGNKAHGDTDEECLEDNRVEGTTAYLPPEVILGGVPSRAADSWALGCVIFQCIAGRPPLLDLGGATMTKQKIVTFEISSETSDSDFFLENSEIRSFSQSSKNVIKRLLTKMPSERPDMRNIAEDDFFQGKNIFALHRSTPHHLDAGKVGPSLNSE
jgi:serine/threonine protein kinase